MDNQYQLKPGKYFFGDPSIVIQKKGKAIQFSNELWRLVYEDRMRLKCVVIDQMMIYVMKSVAGDGMFQGIGTDSGVICLMRYEDLMDDNLFKIPSQEKGFKWIIIDQITSINEENGIFSIGDILSIDTNE